MGDHQGFAYAESHSEGNCTGSFMIREGDWKYLHFTWYDDLLFNLSDDPKELNNRKNDPSTKNVQNELKNTLNSFGGSRRSYVERLPKTTRSLG